MNDLSSKTAHPLRSVLAKCRRHFGAAAAFSALLNVLYIVPTIYMLQVYDRVVPTKGITTLAFLTAILTFSIMTLALLDWIRIRLLARAGAALDCALSPALLEATLGHSQSSQARQALRDADQFRLTLTGPGILALFDAPWLPIYLAVCFLLHPLIGIMALTGALVLPGLSWLGSRTTRLQIDRARDIAASSYLAQSVILDNAEAIRALGMRGALVHLQLRARERMVIAQTTSSLAGGAYAAAARFVRLLIQSLALGLGAWLAIHNEISAGMIFASSFLIARALSPIEQLVSAWRGLLEAKGTYERLDRLLMTADEPRRFTALPAPKGALALQNVVVLKPARDGAVLHGLSFKISAGEVIAVVGPSGAGKSTLARLIAGAAAPDRGIIRLDGADLADWDPEQLGKHVGYLPQQPSLLPGTIAQNIARFSGEVTGLQGDDQSKIDNQVIAAAEAVNARSLIQQLAGGFDHTLGQDGGGLSAGQIQRVALARAVFGQPSLVVLDEPNAHLDNEGDAALIETIAQLKRQGVTVLIVSHKLGILPVVDRVLVLVGGKITQFGSRDEVMTKLARHTAT